MMRRPTTRHSALLACVLLTHGAALWALQHGLMQRVADSVTPAQVLTELSLVDEAPAPRAPAKPAPAPQRHTATPLSTPVAVARHAATPTLHTLPSAASAQPLALAGAAATETAPASANSTATAPSGTATRQTATTAAPGPVQLPSSDADYLHNPQPTYPALSRRLGEQGRVVVRTLIGTDGVPQQAEVLRSSGFERLDRAAVSTALKWRYVPGKRAGVPETMWFNLPLHFVLD